MIIKGLIEEDFVQYRKPSMTIFFPNCTFKCEKDCGERVCQNSALATSKAFDTSRTDIVNRYMLNPISKSIVFSGLEPFDSWSDLKLLVDAFRQQTDDDIVIFTGYTEDELQDRDDFQEDKILWLQQYKNIVIKFGRFIPNQEHHFDEVLGVELASPNQYARRIS